MEYVPWETVRQARDRAEARFFSRQLDQLRPLYYDYDRLERQTAEIYRQMMPDTATGYALDRLFGLVSEPYSFEDFTNLVKRIVNIWAESQPDITKRAAMLELYPAPLAR